MRLVRRRELLMGGVAALAVPDLSAANVLGTASSDQQVLGRLVEIEQAIVLGYERVVDAGVLSVASRVVVSEFVPHEREHVRILSAELERRGHTPPLDGAGTLKGLGLAESPHNSPAAVHYLIALETIAEAAYWASMARLSDAALVRLAAEIMACEAQHWTALSGLLHAGDVYSGVPQPAVTGG